MATLRSLRIRNYRCFSDHEIDIRRQSVVVGRNNAGKTTLIEALRIVAVALTRFRSVVALPPPNWLTDIEPGPGQRLDLPRLGISRSTIFHRYQDPPAIIDAYFDDNSQLTTYVGPEGEAHAVFARADGTFIRRRAHLSGFTLPRVAILPQITPLERDEKILVPEYVQSHLDSALASRHFRNQIHLLWDPHFRTFRDLVEESWHGVRIDGLEGRRGSQGALLELMVRDGDFVAEVGWMGHGLQMWLQTIWFVARSLGCDTLVLDEPDVYMHPDLQRRLFRFLRRQHPQLIVATHSTEILAETDPETVLILDREKQRSAFATDVPSVQKLVERIGSAQNLQIARLWRARALILVEGDDLRVLKRAYDLLFPDASTSLDLIPNWSIGGWSGWPNAIGAANALKNSVHEGIRCFCVLDSDYHTDTDKRKRLDQARTAGIDLSILQRKEIENYLITPRLIRRVIEFHVRPPKVPPDERQIDATIRSFAESMLDDARDNYLTEFLNEDRQAGPRAASQKAREFVKCRLDAGERPHDIVSGKQLLSALSDWSKREYDVSFGVPTLLRSMRSDDVPTELSQWLHRVREAVGR